MANNLGPMAGRPQGIKAESGVGPLGVQRNGSDPKQLLPTLIYDYFLKSRQPDLAQNLLDSPLHVNTKPRTKTSPSGRDVNGFNDSGDSEPRDEIAKRIETMPVAELHEQLPNESFLQDWFNSFWDVWSASRNMAQNPSGTAAQYLNSAQRMKTTNTMMMNGPMRNQFLQRQMNNPSLKQQAMNNIQMSRLGGNMNFPGSQLGQQGVDGQRPNSPSSGDNAPSPKRPRVDGGFPAPPMGGNPAGPGQMPNGQGQNMAPNGMDPNNLALMNSMQGLVGADSEARVPNPQGGALADYQMQLMLLEQQNKRRLLMARQEQEVVQGTGGPTGATPQPAVMGGPGMPFPPHPGMSPRRGGQSPSPHDALKRNASQMGQSPRPDAMGGATRGSPAPGNMFDPQNPQMSQQQLFQMKQMNQGGMMPGGGPGFPAANGQMKQPMGVMPRPGAPPGQFPPFNQSFGQNPQQPPQNGNNPNQPGNQPPGSMPPPQAPAGNNATGRTNPSSPAPAPAPQTPSQNKNTGSKAKKDAGKKDPPKGKQQQPKKAGATPSSEQQTPPPSTPITPHPPPNPIKGNNQQQANTNPQPGPPNGAQPHPAGQPLPELNPHPIPDNSVNPNSNISIDGLDFDIGGSNDVLDGFDFDSFLQVDPASDNFAFDAPFNLGGDGMDMAAGDQ